MPDINLTIYLLHYFHVTISSRFEALKRNGITILEGKRLSEALANQPDEGIENTVIESEIEELKKRKEMLLNQKQNYIKQLNMLKYNPAHEKKLKILYSIKY